MRGTKELRLQHGQENSCPKNPGQHLGFTVLEVFFRN